MRNFFIIRLVLLVGLVSCKKDRLTNEKSVLVGEWEWVYSIKKGTMTSPPFASYTDTIFPSELSSTYGLTFLKKRKVQLIENNEIKGEYRTVFNKFEDTEYGLLETNPWFFQLVLNNDAADYIDGWVNSDSLAVLLPRFPFPFGNSSRHSIIYKDFYKKVN